MDATNIGHCSMMLLLLRGPGCHGRYRHAIHGCRFYPGGRQHHRLREELDVPGGSAEVRDMTAWRNAGQLLRDGVTTVPNRGMLLEWAAGGDPAYILNLPEGMAAERGLSLDHALSLRSPTWRNREPSDAYGWSLRQRGVVVRLPLDQFGPMPPLLPAQLVRPTG